MESWLMLGELFSLSTQRVYRLNDWFMLNRNLRGANDRHEANSTKCAFAGQTESLYYMFILYECVRCYTSWLFSDKMRLALVVNCMHNTIRATAATPHDSKIGHHA